MCTCISSLLCDINPAFLPRRAATWSHDFTHMQRDMF
jgi:hypothetical protein